MIFKDRLEAAMKLLPFLEEYKRGNGIVLAVPRGGVPLGLYIAKKLSLPLELVLTKKIGHPESPEFAIGAVSLEGSIINPRTNVPAAYIESETKRIQQILKERYIKFMGNKRPCILKGKTVILVDDGIATGNTILASLQLIRKKNPEKIILAVPVAPPETLEKLKPYVNDLICLHAPPNFMGVGQFYMDFKQVSDEEVIRLLKEANGFHKAA